MRRILVVTSGCDETATRTIDQLDRRNVSVARLNTNRFQCEVKLTLDLSQQGDLKGIYHLPEGDIIFDDIGLVWYRRIAEPELDETGLASEPWLRQWVAEEVKNALIYSLTVLNAPIINPFDTNKRVRDNKWVQMITAAKLGLQVPLSRLTSSLEKISEFWDMVSGSVIFKPISRGLCFTGSGDRLLVQTTQIPPERMTTEDLHRMRFNPIFLQQLIPKKYDIRAVVVGETVFAFAIHSQEIEEAKIDYRRAFMLKSQWSLRHEAIALGEAVNRKLVALVKTCGNHLGVIDLIETPSGELVFLEDNPEGQWAWLQDETGIPIADAVAEYLTTHVK